MNNPKECFRNMCNKTDRWFPNFWKINQKELDTIEKALDEHEQYKAIEKELGIDLVILFKALNNGIYSNHYAYLGEEIHKIDVVLRKNNDGFYLSGGLGEGHDFKDYGKTWALTREEL